eukprot:11162544-Lingulodinium_polyedra.AAC.1
MIEERFKHIRGAETKQQDPMVLDVLTLYQDAQRCEARAGFIAQIVSASVASGWGTLPRHLPRAGHP